MIKYTCNLTEMVSRKGRKISKTNKRIKNRTISKTRTTKYKKSQKGGEGNYIQKRGKEDKVLNVPPVHRPCNPKVILNKTTATQDTCLTESLLQKLIDNHNKVYPQSKINQQQLQADKVLDILRENSKDCKHSIHTDKCMLKKAGLEKHSNDLFAPQHDWKNPKEWLSNFNIKAVMDMYSKSYPHFHFFGPVPINFDDLNVCPNNGDNLCHFNLEKELLSGKTKFGFIFNLDFDKGPGTHWVSMFYDASPNDPKKSLLFFFDSAGKNNTPNDRFLHIQSLANNIIQQTKNMKNEKYIKLREHPPVLQFNEKQHQSGNTECGVYSLFFIITMLTRKSNVEQPNELSNHELLDLFNGKNGIIEDHYVEQYRKVFFTEPV